MPKVKINFNNLSKLDKNPVHDVSKLNWSRAIVTKNNIPNNRSLVKISNLNPIQTLTNARFRSKSNHNQNVWNFIKPAFNFLKSLPIIGLFINIILLPLVIFGGIFQVVWNFIRYQSRESLIRYTVSLLFLILVTHLANLQIFSFYKFDNPSNPNDISVRRNVVENQRRGQIYIQDFSRNQSKIALTSTQVLANLSIDPFELKKIINNGVSSEEVAQTLAGSLNLSYPIVLDIIKTEISKEEPSRYAVLSKFVSEQQKKIASYLINQKADSKMYYMWLNVRETIRRTYPQGSLLSSTIGYMSRYNVTRDEALKTECRGVVEDNERNGVPSRDYPVGYYGIEQRYCSLLAGRNGRTIIFGSKLQNEDSLAPKNGSDIYLTLDMTLQQKAEELLEQAIKDNTNTNGKPRDGSIIVMDPSTGKVLAIASSPNFDPNNYAEADPTSFKNIGTSEDYEVGSSMKPLTVAAALNEWEKGTIGSQGQKLGIPPTFAKVDFDTQGKIYQELNGSKVYITNSQNVSYSNRTNDLKLIIRDSINTMISEITDSMGNVKLKEYFEDKYLFGEPTEATFAGGGNGSISSFEKNLDCQFCYAQHGFGQGFAISPLQLMRAYTSIANKGKLVEPYIIDKVIDQDGVVDNGQDPSSVLNRPKPKQVLSEQSTRLVTEYMKAVIDEGYLGQSLGKDKIPGYSIAAKTGTAQVTRQNNGEYCDYSCNTKKGLFDHTVIGFGPTQNAKVMVIVKLSQPRPGVVTNFADTTTMPTFREMMRYSLEYLGIPKDR